MCVFYTPLIDGSVHYVFQSAFPSLRPVTLVEYMCLRHFNLKLSSHIHNNVKFENMSNGCFDQDFVAY